MEKFTYNKEKALQEQYADFIASLDLQQFYYFTDSKQKDSDLIFELFGQIKELQKQRSILVSEIIKGGKDLSCLD